MTAEQSPQVSGSLTSAAQTGQYNGAGRLDAEGGLGEISIIIPSNAGTKL
jgi:hypothetical protein